MKIERFEEFGNLNEKKRAEIFGVDRRPSNKLSRQDQDFYDYYTRSKFKGMSKYELNSEVYKLAQRKDDIGVLAQFCLQIERESIASDENIVDITDRVLKSLDSELSVISELGDKVKQGIEVDDIQTKEIEELRENKKSRK